MIRRLPTISIVIPTFNAESYLGQCLSTIAKQQYPNTEVIIIDGKSTDRTPTIAARYKKLVTTFVSEPDRGQGDAVEKGLRLATGDIVHWHAADDIILPGAFFRVAKEFVADDSLDLVFSNGIAFDHSRVYAGDHVQWVTFWTSLLFFGRFQSDCAYWRHRITQQGLPIDWSKPVTCDEDFFLRLWAGRRYRWIPQPLGAFRIRSGQVSAMASGEHVARDRRDTRNRLLGELKISSAYASRLRRRWWISYLVGTKVAPKIISAGRYAARKTSGDWVRNRFTRWFFERWITE